MGAEAHRRDDGTSALAALYEELRRLHIAPFWALDAGADHDEDRQVMDRKKAVPFIWKYKADIEPLLHRSAELISLDSSERRSLILVNPGLSPRRASVSTMYTAYRLNDPNEIMPPHRHSPNAIRLGLTGRTNFTGVEGENITFGPGDMVLTPHDTWHNHGNQGDEAAIRSGSMARGASCRASFRTGAEPGTPRPCTSIAGRPCGRCWSASGIGTATLTRPSWSNTSTRPWAGRSSRP